MLIILKKYYFLQENTGNSFIEIPEIDDQGVFLILAQAVCVTARN